MAAARRRRKSGADDDIQDPVGRSIDVQEEVGESIADTLLPILRRIARLHDVGRP